MVDSTLLSLVRFSYAIDGALGACCAPGERLRFCPSGGSCVCLARQVAASWVALTNIHARRYRRRRPARSRTAYACHISTLLVFLLPIPTRVSYFFEFFFLVSRVLSASNGMETYVFSFDSPPQMVLRFVKRCKSRAVGRAPPTRTKNKKSAGSRPQILGSTNKSWVWS